jgi:peptidase E
VTADKPTIVASSIGFRGIGRGPLDWRPGPIYRYAADLARAGARPKLCFLNQATGDPTDLQAAMYAAFAPAGFDVSHLALFPMPNVEDVRGHLLAQDVIWVGGGSVANLVAVWRAHGLPEILRECWQAGVVLGGCSAGSLCWHVGGTTDSFGPALRPFTAGLGFLPYANGVHYDAEAQRRPLMHELVADGTLPDGYATDNGAALVYRGVGLVEVVAERQGALGYEIRRAADGTVTESPLPTRVLADNSKL